MTEVQSGIKAIPDTSVENWYDDHISRVSGRYKRHAAKITIVVGAMRSRQH